MGGVFLGAWQLLMLRLGWAPLNATDGSRSRSPSCSHFHSASMQKFIEGQQFSFPFGPAFLAFFPKEPRRLGNFRGTEQTKSFPLCGYEVELPDEAEYILPLKLFLPTREMWRCSVPFFLHLNFL